LNVFALSDLFVHFATDDYPKLTDDYPKLTDDYSNLTDVI